MRLLAPQCFRQFVAGVETEDDPRDIISEWAKLLECPLADLTGGTWERISDKSGSVVVGHLRVSRSLAHKIVNLSGTRALFATRLDKAVERPQVAWVPKPKDESTEDYLRRVAAEAQTRRVSQVFRQGFRQGGMSNLGLSGVPASEFDKSAVKQWLLHMARWTQIDISAFLLSQGWRQAQVITRRKSWTKGNPPEWIFQGLKPDGSPADQTTWFYADESTQLSVGPVPPRKRAPAEATSIPGPRKRWVDQDDRAPRSDASLTEAPRLGASSSAAQGIVRTGDVDGEVGQREQQKLKRNVAPAEGPMDWDGDDEILSFTPLSLMLVPLSLMRMLILWMMMNLLRMLTRGSLMNSLLNGASRRLEVAATALSGPSLGLCHEPKARRLRTLRPCSARPRAFVC